MEEDDMEYYSYPTHVDFPCRIYGEEEMSSSSDSDVTPNKPWTFAMSSLEVKPSQHTILSRSKKPSEVKLESFIGSINSCTSGKPIFYPAASHKEMKRHHPMIIKCIEELVYEKCFVLLGRCLASTLNITNRKVAVPKNIICDMCVFSENNPPLLLSFTETRTESEKCEMYNTHLARDVNDILRTYMHESITVVSGVVVKGKDIEKQIASMKDASDASMFSLPNSTFLSSSNGTLRSAVYAILTEISRVKSWYFLKDNFKAEYAMTLTPEEFEQVMEMLDKPGDVTYEIRESSMLLILEVACRRARRRHTQLDLTHKQREMIDVQRIGECYPLLQLTKDAKKRNGLISGKLKRIPYKPKLVKQDEDNRTSTKTSTSSSKSTMTHTHTPEVTSERIRPGRTEEKCVSSKNLVVDKCTQFVTCLVIFFLLYQREVQSSLEFCIAKCTPLLFLIKLVGQECDFAYLFGNSRLLLLLGLVCSCIGDGLFVWKKSFFGIGVLCFTLAHLCYAFAFGWKPLNLKVGVGSGIVTFFVFRYFTSNLSGFIYLTLIVYTISITLMGWRSLASVDTTSGKPTIQSMISAMCFLICNIAIGIDQFIYSNSLTHIVSMVTYYTAQLGVSISILKRTEMNSNAYEDITGTFIHVSVICLLLCCAFGLECLAQLGTMNNVLLSLAGVPCFVRLPFSL